MATVELIMPCFNEEANLEKFFTEFKALQNSFQDIFSGEQDTLKLLVVDNGSTDGSRDIIEDFCRSSNDCRAIFLSRNFGKEASLSAGINESLGDAVVPIDADLQDPLALIPDLVIEWKKGADVVLARRRESEKPNYFRKMLSTAYFKLFNSVSDLKIPQYVGEFRLMDKKVVEAFRTLTESERFVRGLFAYLGFRTVVVDFVRPSRMDGKSKFSFSKLIDLGTEGLTSFSNLPLRVSSFIGFLGAGASMAWGIMILVQALSNNVPVQGYSSTILAVIFLGSCQLISIGVLGEYVGKTLKETKKRPLYIVSKRLN